jgi:rhodanese-related sulfurtransferase
MNIKSSHTLVAEALKEIKTITQEEALKLSNDGKCTLIDIREKGELDKMGRVENSNHIPRGMLEFWLDPDGPYFKS